MASRSFKVISGLLLFLFSLISFGFCQNDVTITTYYPSPSGLYSELRLFPQADKGPDCTTPGSMYYNSTAQLIYFCDGSDNKWRPITTSRINKKAVFYDIPGTYTFIVPAGVTQIIVEVQGAGGGGGGGVGKYTAWGSICGGAGGGGGGGGAYAVSEITVIPAQTFAVVVGEGGDGSNGVSGLLAPDGLAGEQTSFDGWILYATGGFGGHGGLSGMYGFGGIGGYAFNWTGAYKNGGYGLSSTVSFCDNAGGGNEAGSVGGNGGSSGGDSGGQGGIGGSVAIGDENGADGNAGVYGSGGGGGGGAIGSGTGGDGGKGGNGFVRITYFL